MGLNSKQDLGQLVKIFEKTIDQFQSCLSNLRVNLGLHSDVNTKNVRHRIAKISIDSACAYTSRLPGWPSDRKEFPITFPSFFVESVLDAINEPETMLKLMDRAAEITRQKLLVANDELLFNEGLSVKQAELLDEFDKFLSSSDADLIDSIGRERLEKSKKQRIKRIEERVKNFKL